MAFLSRSLAFACAVGLSCAFASLPARAELSASQKSEIEAVVKSYLVEHPEVVHEALLEIERRQKTEEENARRKAVTDLSGAIFDSEYQAVVGNPKGKITLVEFFDYNCGYCKKSLDDMTRLIKEDPELRVVLKDFPVLGPGSVEAAQIAIALRRQFKGDKYFQFHQKLLGTRGQIGKTQALAVAKDMGADIAKLMDDVGQPATRANLDEVMKVADKLGLTGTPTFVMGDEVVVGSVGYDEMKSKVSNLRKCGKATCG